MSTRKPLFITDAGYSSEIATTDKIEIGDLRLSTLAKGATHTDASGNLQSSSFFDLSDNLLTATDSGGSVQATLDATAASLALGSGSVNSTFSNSQAYLVDALGKSFTAIAASSSLVDASDSNVSTAQDLTLDDSDGNTLALTSTTSTITSAGLTNTQSSAQIAMVSGGNSNTASASSLSITNGTASVAASTSELTVTQDASNNVVLGGKNSLFTSTYGSALLGVESGDALMKLRLTDDSGIDQFVAKSDGTIVLGDSMTPSYTVDISAGSSSAYHSIKDDADNEVVKLSADASSAGVVVAPSGSDRIKALVNSSGAALELIDSAANSMIKLMEQGEGSYINTLSDGGAIQYVFGVDNLWASQPNWVAGMAKGDTALATMGDLLNAAAGIFWKEPVNAASTEAVALSGSTPLVIDGLTVTNGMRILLKDQGMPGSALDSANGIYVFTITGGSGGGSYTTARAGDTNSGSELSKAAVLVLAGSTNIRQAYVCSQTNITVDTTPISFVQFTGLADIVAGNGVLYTGNTLSVKIDGSHNRLTFTADGAGGPDFLDVQGVPSEFYINDSQVSVNFTAANAGTLFDGSGNKADALHSHDQSLSSAVAGEAVAVGEAVYYSAANAVSKASQLIVGSANVARCVGVVVSGNLTAGGAVQFVRSGLAAGVLAGYTAGEDVWLDDDGGMTQTKPMVGRLVRMGLAVSATDLFVQIADMGNLIA